MLACGADAEFPTGAEPGAARGGGGADPSGAVGPLRERLLGGGRSAPPHSAPSRPALPVLPAPRVAPPRPADGAATAPRGSLPPMNGEGWAGGAGPGLHYVTVFVSAASLWIGGGGEAAFSARPIGARGFSARLSARSVGFPALFPHFLSQPIEAWGFVARFSAQPIGARLLFLFFSPTNQSASPRLTFFSPTNQSAGSSRSSQPTRSQHGASSRSFSVTNQSLPPFSVPPIRARRCFPLFSAQGTPFPLFLPPANQRSAPHFGGMGGGGGRGVADRNGRPHGPIATRGAGAAPPDWYGRNEAFYWLRGARGCTAGAGTETERGAAAVAIATGSSNRKLRCGGRNRKLSRGGRNRKLRCRGRNRKRARREALGGRDGGVGDGGDLRARRGHLGAVVHLFAEELQDAVPELRAENGPR